MLKKFVTAMIIASMLTTGAYALAADQESVTAEAATAAEISAEQLLISVKEKITVPEELTEMSTSVSSGSGQTFYNFTWEAKDEYKGSLQVRCDSDGNIWNYYYYPENDEIKQSENFIPMEQLGEVAVQELKKLAPGCFNEGDTFELSDMNYDKYSGNTYTFARYKDGIRVDENAASITLRVSDGNTYVSQANIVYDYNAQFDAPVTTEDYEEKYTALAKKNLEYYLIYGMDEEEIGLRYRVLAPYMDPATGEEVLAQSFMFDNNNRYDYATEDTAASVSGGGGSNGAELTEQEIAELAALNELKTKEECESILRAIPEFGIDETMVMDNYRIYEYNDEYKITVTFVGDSDGEESGFSKYFYCTLDGKTGYIEGVNNRIAMPLGEKTALNEEEVAELNINNEDFLKKYLEDFSGYVMTEQAGSKDENGNITVSETYTKEIDGVPFINDTVTISYSADKENVYYINGIRQEIPAEIPPVEQAVSEEEMYSTLMEKCPVTQVYIYDGEKYVTAYTMDTGIIYVNALTNQVVNYNNKPITDEKSYEYTDIDGHWAEDTIKLFAERQMSFPGDTFRPEESITTGDFYRLMTAVSRGSNTCFDMSDEEIIPDIADMLGIDKNGVDTSASVTRETAAKMLIVEMGYGDVAELEDIFVCDFADADAISPDNIGYCALAQGFGIINGEYGYFYPANNITRAEALTMLYNAIDLI